MISSRIKWSPHNKSEYLVISEYIPNFSFFVPGPRNPGYMSLENSIDLSYRNVGLFKCQNLKGFDMSTPCDFSLVSAKDSYATIPDSPGSSSSSSTSASLPTQQNPSSRSTSPAVGGTDAANPSSMMSSAFDGNPLMESSEKSYIVTDDGLFISNRGNRPVSSKNLSFSLNPGIRVAEWSPKDNLVVLGDESGNGLVADPVQNFKNIGYFSVENKIRSINILSWNKCDSSKLAVGYSYSKLEDSVNVWDINSIATSPYNSFAKVSKPRFTRSTPSAPVALSWRPNDDNLLFWGCDSRSIGFFDLRGSAGKSQTFTTDFSYGIVFNPFDPDIFASYSQDGTQIHIWDVKNMKEGSNKPQSVYYIDAKGPIKQIEWSQKRRWQLGAIVGDDDSTEILCWDLTTSNGSDIVSLPKRSPKGKYVSFAWHPDYEGSVIALSDIPEQRQWFVEGVSFWSSFPIEYHPTGLVSFTCGTKVFTTQKPLKDDISATMRERILKGYGIDVKANIAVLQNNPELKKVWEEIQYARDNDASVKKIIASNPTAISAGVSGSSSSSSSSNDAIGKADGGLRLMGEKGRDSPISEKDVLRQAIPKRGINPSMQSSQVKPVPSPGIQPSKPHDIDIKDDAVFIGCASIISLESGNRNMLKSDSSTRMFQSPIRECCKRLCGWNFGSEPKLKVHEFTAFISYLKSQKEYERAAAIAVFNQRYQDALDSLKEMNDYLQQTENPDNKGYLEALRLLIFALASYQDSQNFFNTLAGKTWSQSWNSICRTTDMGSYLSSIPTFLQDQNLSSCNVILKLQGMRLADRIAFGCCYVNTKELEVFAREEEKIAVKEGDLRGLILCGVNTENSFELLQKYIDRTGDVQTACLISLIPYHVGVSTTRIQVQRWLKVYRGLFDVWKLWNERALLDVKVQAYLNHADVPPQVYALCKCGRPLKSKVENESLSKISKQHTSFCPECHAPLPRCSVCLLPLDCIRVKSYSLSASPSREFGHWWSWCQTCGHGGHISHVQEWFSCHSICPANGCKCQCRNQDKFLFVGNNSSEQKHN